METDLFAPVQTIFPELKIKAVVLGSRILMITAANRWRFEAFAYQLPISAQEPSLKQSNTLDQLPLK